VDVTVSTNLLDIVDRYSDDSCCEYRYRFSEARVAEPEPEPVGTVFI
jgi:hypothetical protein